MDSVIRFPYWLSSSRYYMSSSLFFICSVWQTGGLQKKKRHHCLWNHSFYTTKFACNANLILPEMRQVSYKFLLQKWLNFLPPQDTLNWDKSFLFISLLYMPDKVWLSFCENTVNLHFRGSIPIHCHIGFFLIWENWHFATLVRLFFLSPS